MYKNPYFTIFTPTYNRAHTLAKVYKSLSKQSYTDFEWLIIDDGSSDNTADIVQKWRNSAYFPIDFYRQKHSGKHVAINRAVKHAKGYFFIIADSDDEFVGETLEFFFKSWNRLTKDQQKSLAGIRCLAKNGYTGEIIGEKSKVKHNQIDYEFPLNLKRGFYHETWGTIKTEIMKKYPFPEIKSIYFIPEGFVWNRICRRFPRLLTNKVLRIIYHQNDGFSKNLNSNIKRHALGFYIYYLKNISDNSDIMMKYAPMRLLKECIQLGRVGRHAKIPISFTINRLKSIEKVVVFILCYPFAMILSTADQYNRKIR